MPNVLVRGLSDMAVKRIDASAFALGLSRNEYLRRTLEGHAAPRDDSAITAEDWQRSAAAFADLADPSVMDAAWR
ncbi:MAG: hypothetical protein D3X82_15000 [Candidatus Leucobacter sulfamidivorax]|jgi:hypothetical protein|nr:hypothetical protein [Candidatus Leucobacter sulfamidivorax]